MPILDRSDIETGSPLVGTYAYHPAQHERGGITAIVHGVCHSNRGFNKLSDALNEHDISTVLVNLQTDTRRGARNSLTIDQYAQGLHAVLEAFESDNHIRIDSVAGHSAGGRTVQIMQNAHPEWRRPTVLMAPIPLYGTLPMLARMTIHHPWMVAKTLTGELRYSMRSNREIKILFGDADMQQSVIDEIKEQINHTSYRMYLQLMQRQDIQEQRQPMLLMISKTDGMFPPRSYRGLEKHYPNMVGDVEIPGGHDFFIAHPEETAAAYADFHYKHAIYTPVADPEADTINFVPEPKSPAS